MCQRKTEKKRRDLLYRHAVFLFGKVRPVGGKKFFCKKGEKGVRNRIGNRCSRVKGLDTGGEGMDDEKIIALFMERSEQAITETSQKYGRYCHYIAYQILRNEEDSEECVNDTYLRAWHAIPPKHPNRLQTFLGKITRHLSLNKLEKQSAQKRGAGQKEAILHELTQCLPAQEDTACAVDGMMIREVLNRFLAGLPAETRKLFVRRYWYMSPIKEIAKDYGLSESKVAVTLFRTREKLKTAFEKEGIIL